MTRVKVSVWIVLAAVMISAGMMLLPAVKAGMLPTETPANVSLAAVLRGDICGETALRGSIRYTQEYAAVAPVSGIVAEVYVSPGEQVAKGQALLRMDTTVQAAAISNAYAAEAETAWLPEEIDAQRITTAAIGEKTALLEAMTLRAAADGRVVAITAGQYSGVAAGSPAVTLCGGQQQIVCMAAVSDAAELSRGMWADILAHGEKYCGAVVEYVGAAQADMQTGQMVCPVTLMPEKEIDLPIGAPVEAEIARYRYENVTVLPITAVTENGTVWVVSDGRCWEMAAEIVEADQLLCWVNLPAGTLVVDRPQGLVQGQRIQEVGR